MKQQGFVKWWTRSLTTRSLRKSVRVVYVVIVEDVLVLAYAALVNRLRLVNSK